MKPLVILILSFCFSLVATKFIGGRFEYALAGRIAMSVMLLFTAMGHFRYRNGMAMMLPASVPFKSAVISLTGVIEIGAAIGLQISWSQVITAWLLIFFLLGYCRQTSMRPLRESTFRRESKTGKGLAIYGSGYLCKYSLSFGHIFLQ